MGTVEINTAFLYSTVNRLWLRFVATVFLIVLFGTQEAKSTEPDLQLWMPVQLIHPVGEKWAVSMQAETRLKEDISEFSQLVLKPAINHHFNDTLALQYVTVTDRA